MAGRCRIHETANEHLAGILCENTKMSKVTKMTKALMVFVCRALVIASDSGQDGAIVAGGADSAHVNPTNGKKNPAPNNADA
jgi:hypothetical protein